MGVLSENTNKGLIYYSICKNAGCFLANLEIYQLKRHISFSAGNIFLRIWLGITPPL
jgi:hypothetical protein